LLTQTLAQAEVQSLLEPALNRLAISALPTSLQALRDLLVQGLAHLAIGQDCLLCTNNKYNILVMTNTSPICNNSRGRATDFSDLFRFWSILTFSFSIDFIIFTVKQTINSQKGKEFLKLKID
jgi:hypothetical protein